MHILLIILFRSLISIAITNTNKIGKNRGGRPIRLSIYEVKVFGEGKHTERQQASEDQLQSIIWPMLWRFLCVCIVVFLVVLFVTKNVLKDYYMGRIQRIGPLVTETINKA